LKSSFARLNCGKRESHCQLRQRDRFDLNQPFIR
jgi:hypothetical protein